MGYGRNLGNILKGRQISIGELSRSCGIPAGAICAWVRQDEPVPYTQAVRIAEALRISIRRICEDIPGAHLYPAGEGMGASEENERSAGKRRRAAEPPYQREEDETDRFLLLDLLFIYNAMGLRGRKTACRLLSSLNEPERPCEEE